MYRAWLGLAFRAWAWLKVGLAFEIISPSPERLSPSPTGLGLGSGLGSGSGQGLGSPTWSDTEHRKCWDVIRLSENAQ
ncbi:uncharacterized protein EV420DRAFT_1531962 [Desarmillaria tabescens]|uniref:Secreted protein n=1 Tax=Armillaria tabescens TaxID=1929756 RepID=A0AA39KHU9_ARMTA|nr:uncharacterized protein EV420DRAFT_1531962 [Desarmillaria tabescens]KAK0460380.1 hypothetical protein EV420DRAFT_1531962 [Desarmillaria tabescens]